uniref:AsnC family transcriptional regulator n=1 Tax=Pseudonocardia pini TaxID=2758030 RepID=UPI0015F0DF9C
MESWRDGREAWDRLARRLRTGDAALDALSDIGSLRRLLDRAELEAVRDARGARRSWAEIATRLGVSRQSAWERWKDLDEEGARGAGEAARARHPEPEEHRR